ncbi:MAG TPA: enoyl-CoA hydratase-related protein [Mycobacteriales bacterium]|nr:enoyl-CoA hydratase-related protein [Mycobacteriales bacterium]
MTDSSYETVLVDISDGVATVTLNRPDKLNSFNWKMDGEFHEAMWKCEADEDVRVIVVTGAGRAFCGGMDLTDGAEDVFGDSAHKTHDEKFKTDSDHIAERSAFWRMRTPVIAAINGAAVGAGLTITTMFDIRFVAEDAKLGFNFVRRGVVPDASVTWTLPRIVGATRALDLLVTGRMFNGRDAVEYGLALSAHPADQVLAVAQEYARELAANTAPGAVAATKALINRFLEFDDRNSAMALETKLVWWSGAQPDAVEGVMSFMEKRSPSWKGSKHAAFPEHVWPED